MTTPATAEPPAVAHIITAMGDIMELVDAIEKVRQHGTPGEPGPKFKFRGIDDVLNALHPHFAKNRVLIVPVTLEQKTEVRPTKNGTTLHTVVKARFHFISTRDGSQWPISPEVPGEAADTGDKGLGKAMSYALKLALIEVFLIPTEGDNDPDASGTEWAGQNGQRQPQQTRQGGQRQPQQQGQAQPAKGQKPAQELTPDEQAFRAKINSVAERFAKCRTRLEVDALAEDAHMSAYIGSLKTARLDAYQWLKGQLDAIYANRPDA